MKILHLFFLFLPVMAMAQPNRAELLFQYVPAPGQFINLPLTGTPAAAQRMVSVGDNHVSLGSFGGYIVLGFPKPVKNHPANPYGIDFTISGNAFPGSSEPGVVWVMKDENGNGLPDDTWYEIAGSSHFDPATIRRYQITYYRQTDGSARWTDNQGGSGILGKNQFHSQPYYPQNEYFTGYPVDSVMFRTTKTAFRAETINGQIFLPPLAFGYADNQPVNRGVDQTLPDNPYTRGVIEGAGGDGIDISWAIDANGQYVDLDEISFIKVATGVMLHAGHLGEVSTEIAAAVATTPTGTTGPDRLTLIYQHPMQVLPGDTIRLAASYFIKGRKTDTQIVFESDRSEVAEIIQNGALVARKGGSAVISAIPAGFPDEKATTSIVVVEPVSVDFATLETSLFAGSTKLWQPRLLDLNGATIPDIAWQIEVTGNNYVQFLQTPEGWEITALAPGATVVKVIPVAFPHLAKELSVTVHEAPTKINVFVTVKTSGENLLPLQWMEVGPAAVNPYVESRTFDFQHQGWVSLAYVAIAALNKAGVAFRFRDDLPGENPLYLWSVEDDGLFTYGWGGKTEPAAFARAWFFRKNQSHYATGLDKVNVSDGDTVIIYHVPNILESWELSLLNVSPGSAIAGDELSIETTGISCHFVVPATVIGSASYRLSNQMVTFSDVIKSAVSTGSDGRAIVTLAVSPPLTVYSGNNAALVLPRLTTGLSTGLETVIAAYPNPVVDFIRFTGLSGHPADIVITGLNGQVLHRGSLAPDNPVVDVRRFSYGIYFYILTTPDGVFQGKFLRQ